ncbi:flagellar protein FliS [Paenibacillus elgii]|uniref:Flagellar secretion chaperone FliS n=1 Tax=Paenibacillus elgii TaxID=189691 RepID=A0A163XHE6_9BACL|nr:flagellar export chaperone FliS [Paenibacillus elgii]KZE77888.1 flagellar protein FliS [Paenibacillus elgii]
MNQQAQQLYLRTQVSTAAPGELTLLLFNGCIKFMKQAQEALVTKNYNEKNVNLKKAQDIIDELMITLNMDYEISKNLKMLYVFIKEQLFEANFKLSMECLETSISLVTELRDTWVEALKILKNKATVVG